MPLIRGRHGDRWVLLSSGSPTATEWPCLPLVWREIDKRGPQTSPSREASGFSFSHSPSSVLLVLQVTHLMSSPPQPCLDPGFLPSPNFCLFRTTQHSLCVRGPTRAEPQHKAAGVSAEEWDPRGRQAKQAHPVTTQQSVTGERGGEERCSSFPKNSGLLALRES